MYSIIYLSKANEYFSLYDLIGLADKAKKKNEALELTGFLQYRDNNFLQYLEGDEVTVKYLMKTIEQDSRHQIINLLEVPTSKNRLFYDWHMCYVKQESPIQLSLVDLLQDVITHLDNPIYNGEYLNLRITRLLNKISEVRNQTKSHFPNNVNAPDFMIN